MARPFKLQHKSYSDPIQYYTVCQVYYIIIPSHSDLSHESLINFLCFHHLLTLPPAHPEAFPQTDEL